VVRIDLTSGGGPGRAQALPVANGGAVLEDGPRGLPIRPHVGTAASAGLADKAGSMSESRTSSGQRSALSASNDCGNGTVVMQDLEQLIRERAYHLWMEDECRDRQADAH
jgi:hypothetical protein